jgi:AraC family transcriptional regulator, transcriptional activator of pobA
MNPIATTDVHQLVNLITSTYSNFSIRSFERNPDCLKSNPHNRDTICFELIWIRCGQGAITIDDRIHALRNDTVYVVTPGQLRSLEVYEGVSGFIFEISQQLLHLLHDQRELSFLTVFAPGYRVDPIPLQNKEAIAEFLDLTKLMQKEITANHVMKEESLKALLKIFLIYLRYEFDATNRSTEKEKGEVIVGRFLQLLKDRISAMKQVADYAAELNVTPNYLNIVIKRFTGYNASQHIQQFIIMEAKRQAICSGLRMKEIANHLGFADHAHFSKFFKTYSGINFSHFRRSITQGTEGH